MWYALCEVPTISPSGTPAVSMQVCRCSLSPRGDGNLSIFAMVLLCGFPVSAYLQAKLYKKVFERLEAVSRTVPETIEA